MKNVSMQAYNSFQVTDISKCIAFIVYKSLKQILAAVNTRDGFLPEVSKLKVYKSQTECHNHAEDKCQINSNILALASAINITYTVISLQVQANQLNSFQLDAAVVMSC